MTHEQAYKLNVMVDKLAGLVVSRQMSRKAARYLLVDVASLLEGWESYVKEATGVEGPFQACYTWLDDRVAFLKEEERKRLDRVAG